MYIRANKRKLYDEVWHGDLSVKAHEFYDYQDFIYAIYRDDWDDADEIVRTYYAVDPHNWEILQEFETLNGLNEYLEEWTDTQNECEEVFF